MTVQNRVAADPRKQLLRNYNDRNSNKRGDATMTATGHAKSAQPSITAVKVMHDISGKQYHINLLKNERLVNGFNVCFCVKKLIKLSRTPVYGARTEWSCCGPDFYKKKKKEERERKGFGPINSFIIPCMHPPPGIWPQGSQHGSTEFSFVPDRKASALSPSFNADRVEYPPDCAKVSRTEPSLSLCNCSPS